MPSGCLRAKRRSLSHQVSIAKSSRNLTIWDSYISCAKSNPQNTLKQIKRVQNLHNILCAYYEVAKFSSCLDSPSQDHQSYGKERSGCDHDVIILHLPPSIRPQILDNLSPAHTFTPPFWPPNYKITSSISSFMSWSNSLPQPTITYYILFLRFVRSCPRLLVFTCYILLATHSPNCHLFESPVLIP